MIFVEVGFPGPGSNLMFLFWLHVSKMDICINSNAVWTYCICIDADISIHKCGRTTEEA